MSKSNDEMQLSWEDFFEDTKESRTLMNDYGLTTYESMMVLVLQSIANSLAELVELKQYEASEAYKHSAFTLRDIKH